MSKGTVNKVILVGNLGADPEVRTLGSGDKVVNLRVATTETWRNRETQANEDHTEWHGVSAYGKPAEIIAQFMKKGDKMYIEGHLRTRKWQDKAGQDRYSTEVRLDSFEMLGSRNGGAAAEATPVNETPSAETASDPAPARSLKSGGKAAGNSDAGKPSADGNDFDDDIPFNRPACLDGLYFPKDGAWFGNGPMFPFK